MQSENKFRTKLQGFAWQVLLKIFRGYSSLVPYFSYPIIGPFLKKMADLEPGSHTQSYALNINADLTDASQNVVLPIEMMKQLVRESDYRAIMDHCLCRSAYECKDFPDSLGCLFIGEGGKGIVKKGQGHEASIDEALTHIDRAAELGLIGQAMWIEVERLILGVKKNRDVARWLEICFCCPCCCGTFRMIKASGQQDVRDRFRSIGWTAQVDSATCTNCLKCAKLCPVDAISITNKKIAIDQNRCLGCGYCGAHCPSKAIKLELRKPLLNSVQDYFTGSGLRLDL